MKISLIDPSVKELKQIDLLKHVELCARTCYKSEDRITEDSADKFIRNIIKRGHTSVLEHGTVYLEIPENMGKIVDSVERSIVACIYWSHYSVQAKNDFNDRSLITTNFRVVVNACAGDMDIFFASWNKWY